jgi:hypothetical protein
MSARQKAISVVKYALEVVEDVFSWSGKIFHTDIASTTDQMLRAL